MAIVSPPQQPDTPPANCTLTAEAREPDSVLEAEVNLSSRKRWSAWHHWLTVLGITQTHVRTPGADTMLEPVADKGGVQKHCVYLVELRGPASQLAKLDRFRRNRTLLATRKPSPHARVSQRGMGECSTEQAEAARAKQRKARVSAWANRGDVAAEGFSLGLTS